MSTRSGHSLPSYDWARALRRLPGMVCTLEADGRIVAVAGRLFDEDPDVLELTHVWGMAAEQHRGELRQAVEMVVATGEPVQLLVDSWRVPTTFLVEVVPGDPHMAMIWLTVSEEGEGAEEEAPSDPPSGSSWAEPESPVEEPARFADPSPRPTEAGLAPAAPLLVTQPAASSQSVFGTPDPDGLLWLDDDSGVDFLPPTPPSSASGAPSTPRDSAAPSPLADPESGDDLPDFLPFDIPLGVPEGAEADQARDEGSLLRKLKTDHGLESSPRPTPDRGPARSVPRTRREREETLDRTERGARRREASPDPSSSAGRSTLSWGAPTPAPSPRGPVTVKGPAPRRPQPTGGVTPDYVIVAPGRLRRLAARLQRTLDLITPHNVVWFDDEFDLKVHRLQPSSRVIFLGPSKYGDFMRKVVAPAFSEAGACWGMVQRKALIWTQPEAGDAISVARRLDSARAKSAKPGASGDKPPTGKELAGKFLFEPRQGLPDLEEEQYLLGIAMFLLEGFEDFHASVQPED